MAQEVAKNHTTVQSHKKLWLYLLVIALPIILIVLYYISKDNTQLMDWVNAHITAPYRNGAAAVTSLGPFRYFSMAEILITLLGLWALFYILNTIVMLIRDQHRLLILGRRVFILATVGLYLMAAYSWTWGGVYKGTSFSQKSGLDLNGVSVNELTAVTEHFAEQANALSDNVRRDADGHFAEDSHYYFALSKGVYNNIQKEFPALAGNWYPPKGMIYSRLMSVTGFTGVYIALTGETNINVDVPGSLIPVTIAHEMAHQRGISAEEEANFAAIAACITSNIDVYAYSGYLDGLMYLSEALNEADPEAWARISATLSDNVRTDWADNNKYWSQFDTGTSDVVSAMYDSYLKSNGQELGINSYGACVDLLVNWSSGQTA
jgi:hypothetical protein